MLKQINQINNQLYTNTDHSITVNTHKAFFRSHSLQFLPSHLQYNLISVSNIYYIRQLDTWST